jgi:hypothetical protein
VLTKQVGKRDAQSKQQFGAHRRALYCSPMPLNSLSSA